MRHLIPVAVVLLTVGGNWTAVAVDSAVHQKGRKFSLAEVTVARHEPVLFINDDTVPHNIMSVSRENAFNLGSQMPGNEIPVSFSTTGIVLVMCAIHPRMQMTINVTD